jgi:hypothetical protein
VNHVNTIVIHNTYNTTVTNVSENHVSYNGGTGGVEARPTPQQESYANEHHVGPVTAQTQHVQEARNNPELRASANQGKPPIAATAKPGDFKTGVVGSRQAGGEYKAPPANAAGGNVARTANETRPGTENRPENTTEPSPDTQSRQRIAGSQVHTAEHRQRRNRQDLSAATGQTSCQGSARSPEAPAATRKRTPASHPEKLQ